MGIDTGSFESRTGQIRKTLPASVTDRQSQIKPTIIFDKKEVLKTLFWQVRIPNYICTDNNVITI